MDEPKDIVKSQRSVLRFLSDGTNFLEESVLDATAKQIRIKTTNFGHNTYVGAAILDGSR